MPNWSRSEMIVYGDLKILRKFHHDIKKSISSPERIKTDFGKTWLGYIFIDGLNLDLKKDIENQFSKYGVAPRGWVDEINPCFDDKTPHVDIYYQSAWDSRIDDFDILLSKKYPGLSAVTRCEEPDMEIYYHNDASGYWFSNDSYYVDICYRDEDNDLAYDLWDSNLNKKQLFKEINGALDKNFSSIEEIERFIATGNDESYCRIIPVDVHD